MALGSSVWIVKEYVYLFKAIRKKSRYVETIFITRRLQIAYLLKNKKSQTPSNKALCGIFEALCGIFEVYVGS